MPSPSNGPPEWGTPVTWLLVVLFGIGCLAFGFGLGAL